MADKKTKIVATIGPATRDSATLLSMVEAGLDVVRINFSHGTDEEHRATVELVRGLRARTGANLGLLFDLPGPKIRIGSFAESPVELTAGQRFDFVAEEVDGNEQQVSVSHPSVLDAVRPGSEILLGDGDARLHVDRVENGRAVTVVELGGVIGDHKGFSVVGLSLDVPSLTARDEEVARLAAELGADWVAQSFVRREKDVRSARKLLKKHAASAKLMAKIETPAAVKNFDDILDAADGIMVARGDLGVELPPEQVPLIQKRLIGAAQEEGKPVITATQMLESMVQHRRPTRAETSDVANAIFDGSDAVMLSAETAVGRYPVEAVEVMRRVAQQVEDSEEFQDHSRQLRQDRPETTRAAIAKAACEIADTLSAAAILVFTASGASAWRVARNRPRQTVVALTPEPEVRHSLSLVFGVRTELADVVQTSDEMVQVATERARRYGLGQPGERIVITAGVPFGVEGTTNLVWVERIP